MSRPCAFCDWDGEKLSDEVARLRDRPERFVCPDCGYGVKADEDGCCVTCGRDCAIVAVVSEPEDMSPTKAD